MKVDAHYGVDQLAHHHLAVATRRHAKRRDNGDALFRFNHRDLRVEQVDGGSNLYFHARLREVLVDELPMRVARG
jgi:hypothetical protein